MSDETNKTHIFFPKDWRTVCLVRFALNVC